MMYKCTYERGGGGGGHKILKGGHPPPKKNPGRGHRVKMVVVRGNVNGNLFARLGGHLSSQLLSQRCFLQQLPWSDRQVNHSLTPAVHASTGYKWMKM